MGHPRCMNCIYFCKTTDTCDYWLIEDRLRGCDPGAGCTKRTTKREAKTMARWDREKGRQLWLEGKSDKEIAAVFDVHPTAIGMVRRKIWEPERQAAQVVPVTDPDDGREDVLPATAAPTAEEPAQPANCHGIVTPKETEFFGLVAELVKDKQGMDAVITAQVVIALVKGDLQEAQRCIAWLMNH